MNSLLDELALSQEERGAIWESAEAEIINQASSSEEAYMLILEFEYHSFKFTDIYQDDLNHVDCEDWSFHYIWVLYAIVWGIRKYQAHWENVPSKIEKRV